MTTFRPAHPFSRRELRIKLQRALWVTFGRLAPAGIERLCAWLGRFA